MHQVTAQDIAVLKDLTRKLLLGFEVTDCRDGKCTLHSVSEPQASEYDALLRRCFLLIKEMHMLMAQDCVRGTYSSSAAIEELQAYLAGPGRWSLEGSLADPGLDPIRDDPRVTALVLEFGR